MGEFSEGFKAGSAFFLELRKQKQEYQLKQQENELKQMQEQRQQAEFQWKILDDRTKALTNAINTSGNPAVKMTYYPALRQAFKMQGIETPEVTMWGPEADAAMTTIGNILNETNTSPGDKRVRIMREFAAIGLETKAAAETATTLVPEEAKPVIVHGKVDTPQGTKDVTLGVQLSIDPKTGEVIVKKSEPITTGTPTPLINIQAGLPAEAAGRLAGVPAAFVAMKTIQDTVFPGGKPADVTKRMWVLGPGFKQLTDEGRLVQSNLQSMLDPIIRIRTGAALNESEVARIKEELALHILDSPGLLADKLMRAKLILDAYVHFQKSAPQLMASFMAQEQRLFPADQFKSADIKKQLDMILQPSPANLQQLSTEDLLNEYLRNLPGVNE